MGKNLWFAAAALFFSLAGLADAAYLTVAHYGATPLVCNIISVSGGSVSRVWADFDRCGAVTGSEYAEVAGIPVAAVGTLYYLALAALASTLLIRPRREAARALFAVSGLGVLVSAYFVYIQAEVLEAFCLYCLASALVTGLVFIFASAAALVAKG